MSHFHTLSIEQLIAKYNVSVRHLGTADCTLKIRLSAEQRAKIRQAFKIAADKPIILRTVELYEQGRGWFQVVGLPSVLDSHVNAALDFLFHLEFALNYTRPPVDVDRDVVEPIVTSWVRARGRYAIRQITHGTGMHARRTFKVPAVFAAKVVAATPAFVHHRQMAEHKMQRDEFIRDCLPALPPQTVMVEAFRRAIRQ